MNTTTTRPADLVTTEPAQTPAANALRGYHPPIDQRAADVLRAMARAAVIVGDVSDGGDWPDDPGERAYNLTMLNIVAGEMIELAAHLTRGGARARLLAAALVLAEAPFGAGDWGEVDESDLLAALEP